MLLHTGKDVRVCVINVQMYLCAVICAPTFSSSISVFSSVLMIKFNWIVYHLLVRVCVSSLVSFIISFYDGEFHWILSFILWFPQANMLQIVLHSLLTFFAYFFFPSPLVRYDQLQKNPLSEFAIQFSLGRTQNISTLLIQPLPPPA